MIASVSMYQNDLAMPCTTQLLPYLKPSPLSSFMSRLSIDLHIQQDALMVVSDNAKIPAVNTMQSPKQSRPSRRVSNESRWEGSPSWDNNNKKECRWTSLNNDNPRCAGLTRPSRQNFSGSPGYSSPRKKISPLLTLQPKTSVLPAIQPRTVLPPFQHKMVLPPLPRQMGGMPAYKKFSIPKPKTGLSCREVTV